jgi:hypothetical protein
MGVIGPSLRHQRITNSNYVVTPSGGRYINNDVVNENITKTVKINGVENMKKLNMELNSFPNGVMVCWEKIDDCANYVLKLYHRKNENAVDTKVYRGVYEFKPDYSLVNLNCIDIINISRNKCYHTISDLAKTKLKFEFRVKISGTATTPRHMESWISYFVEIIAEDKNGETIAKSDLIAFAPGSQNTVVVSGKNTVTI